MLKPAKAKRGSKSKRKGQKNTGHPLPLWRKCNVAGAPGDSNRIGEFESRTRDYGNGNTQYRGHVHLPDCGCQSALGPRPKSETEIVRAFNAKVADKRLQRQIARNRNCPDCYTLLPVTGSCDNCNSRTS